MCLSATLYPTCYQWTLCTWNNISTKFLLGIAGDFFLIWTTLCHYCVYWLYLLSHIRKVSTSLDILEMQKHLPLLRLLSCPLLSVSLCNYNYLPLSMGISTTLHTLSIGRTSTTHLEKYTDHYLCTALTIWIRLNTIYGWNHYSKIELTDLRIDTWLNLTFITDSLSVTFGSCWWFWCTLILLSTHYSITDYSCGNPILCWN